VLGWDEIRNGQTTETSRVFMSTDRGLDLDPSSAKRSIASLCMEASVLTTLAASPHPHLHDQRPRAHEPNYCIGIIGLVSLLSSGCDRVPRRGISERDFEARGTPSPHPGLPQCQHGTRLTPQWCHNPWSKHSSHTKQHLFSFFFSLSLLLHLNNTSTPRSVMVFGLLALSSLRVV
jgi:hypothetical protein